MKLLVPIALVLAACASTTAPSPETEQRNAALVRQHTEIWQLMELSPAATSELNGIVVAVHTQMDKNRHDKPEAFAKAASVQRAPGALTHDEYVANHKKRFDFLGISAPTQAELMGAANFVWAALHDPNVPPEKKKTAETIQSMMKALGGPPPCCDDNIFARAAP
jgi:hypothetical protein